MSETKESKSLKYAFFQLVFWAIVFGLVLVGIIAMDEIVMPLLKGTICIN
jgi:hypothetical protein